MTALRFQTGGKHLTLLWFLQGKQNSTRKQHGHNTGVTGMRGGGGRGMLGGGGGERIQQKKISKRQPDGSS